MDNQFIQLSSWPRAILHLDADAFFASCEQASLPTKLQAQHEGERGDVPVRRAILFKGENRRQRLPLLHVKVYRSSAGG
jgi:hypothetical protein